MKVIYSLGLALILFFLETHSYCSDGNGTSSPSHSIISTSKGTLASPFSNDKHTQKIIERHELENEGSRLARQGKYDEAILKFKAATSPELLNHDYEKNVAEGCIGDAYKRQGNFEEALQVIDDIIAKHPNEYAREERLEILSLIRSRDTKNNKPIYNYINYLKAKYAKFIPPNGYMFVETGIVTDRFIHLYDYLHDYDAGIAFMDTVINYIQAKYGVAGKKDVAEYTRVKQAWQLDKQTGTHGHLKDVIRTSDIISW